MTGHLPKPRLATQATFRDIQGEVLDQGLALFFSGPHSYTGEDVLELHGHGGSVVLNSLLDAAILAGARLARPGEFTERAFLNDKLDLTQAEAVADLINAVTDRAARSAMRSMQGEFSSNVNRLIDELVAIRAVAEAGLDFPDEAVDDLATAGIGTRIDALIDDTDKLLQAARRGTVLGTGVEMVIAGAPNVGKSTLLNKLARQERAITSETPGTTRDVIHTPLNINGVPVRAADTAGLRKSPDAIEQEGMKRAGDAIAAADVVLLVSDEQENDMEMQASVQGMLANGAVLIDIRNKIDLLGQTAEVTNSSDIVTVKLSAKTGAGVDMLEQEIARAFGLAEASDGEFVARHRHLEAIKTANKALRNIPINLSAGTGMELVAEDLRMAQSALEAITGKFDAEDLLDEIFSRFCLGK